VLHDDSRSANYDDLTRAAATELLLGQVLALAADEV
jgi:hypothetical protein